MATEAASDRAGHEWPVLRVADWVDTRDTLHMWTQIVGKIRMAKAPMVNHWWHVTLYVTPRGVTTSTIPDRGGSFEIEFDFCSHRLRIVATGDRHADIALEAKPVARFYDEVLSALDELGIEVEIWPVPVEVEVAIPFAEDTDHHSYDPDAAQLFWRQLVEADRVLKRFRSEFAGKVSPVHFFWGSFDMAVTRFSGRRASVHPGGAPNCPDWVMVEGYSRELASAGFWPGGGEEGAFYAYAYPEPDGFADRSVEPDEARYVADAGQFRLPYEVVRSSPEPDETLLSFLRSAYAAAADLGDWDRGVLDYETVAPG
jgi:hypothetical protein